MLDTLKKIGDRLLEGQGIWARLVTEPKHNPDKKNWVCPILFDCIDQEIRFLKDEMTLYRKEESVYKYKYLSPEKWGRNGKKCALTIEPKKFSMLEETFFGKKEGDNGSMMLSILDYDPEFENRPIFKALQELNHPALKVQGFSSRTKVLFEDKIRVVITVLPSMMLQVDLYHLISNIPCTPCPITRRPKMLSPISVL